MISLDDTSRCPTGEECANNPAHVGEALTIVTFSAPPFGVFCAALCDTCAEDLRFDPMPHITLALLVAQHSEHIGITIDEMAERYAREDEDIDGLVVTL